MQKQGSGHRAQGIQLKHSGAITIAGIVPVIFRYRGFRLFFYSNEGNPREQPHVHVEKDNTEAKFWLVPEVKVAYNDGFYARTLRALMEIIEANKDRIERAWNEFFC